MKFSSVVAGVAAVVVALGDARKVQKTKLAYVEKSNNEKAVQMFRSIGAPTPVNDAPPQTVVSQYPFGQVDASAAIGQCQFANIVNDLNDTRCENLGALILGSQDSCCVKGTDTSTCRFVGSETAYCDEATEACDLSGDTLNITLDIFTDETVDSVCCRSCSCFGDPECQSFNGTWVEWVECDGRDDTCGYSPQACHAQKDHAGNQCVFNTEKPYWWYQQGSPCQPDYSVSGHANMVMFVSEDGKFGVDLVLGERGSVWWAKLNTTLGQYTLGSESCYKAGNNTANRAAAWGGVEPPAEWTVRTEGSVEYSNLRYVWTVIDPNEGVEMELQCAALWHNGKTGITRIDIPFVRDQVMLETGSGSGFCVSSVIEEMAQGNPNPNTTELDAACWAHVTSSDICLALMGYKCTNPTECATCSSDWCDIANLDDADKANCASDIADNDATMWLTYYATTIAAAAGQNPNVIVLSLTQNALFLDMLVAEYGNGSEQDGIVCGKNWQAYIGPVSECEDKVEVQYQAANGTWITVFTVPASKPFCHSAEHTLRYEDYPELFLRPVRFNQCKAPKSCDTLRCNPVLGFEAELQYFTDHCTPVPTATPTESPTDSPTKSPTSSPTDSPTDSPTKSPTSSPTDSPTDSPTKSPTSSPTDSPTESPTKSPTSSPTDSPTDSPTKSPTSSPTDSPTESPTKSPTSSPTDSPTDSPTKSPTSSPTDSPTESPTKSPTSSPTDSPTESPTKSPTSSPTDSPTESPTDSPTRSPTSSPTDSPTESPTKSPTSSPTDSPTESPTKSPTSSPTESPTESPTKSPTSSPTDSPTESPTKSPTSSPTDSPTESPTKSPTSSPTDSPTESPTRSPTHSPTERPTDSPTKAPTHSPTERPTDSPTKSPTHSPTERPTDSPTKSPTHSPTERPTDSPTKSPTHSPTERPTDSPTKAPTHSPTERPTDSPTKAPTHSPTERPTSSPTQTDAPTNSPTDAPTRGIPPTISPTLPFLGCTCTAQCQAIADPHITNFEAFEFTTGTPGQPITLYKLDEFEVVGHVETKDSRTYINEVEFGSVYVDTTQCMHAHQKFEFQEYLPSVLPMLNQVANVTIECKYGPKDCTGAECEWYLDTYLTKVDHYLENQGLPNNFIQIEESLGTTGECMPAPGQNPPIDPNWVCTCRFSPIPTESPTQAPTPAITISSAPTNSPTPSLTISPAPTTAPTANLTCVVHGDPHVTCFTGDEFQVVPPLDPAARNSSLIYEMDTRFRVVGQMTQELRNGKWFTIVTRMWIWYNDQPMATVDYENQCRPYLPTAQIRSTNSNHGDFQFSWAQTKEFVLIKYACVENALGQWEGMTIEVNKLNADAGSTQADQLQWESSQGYTGACPQCTANQAYFGPWPGDIVNAPTPQSQNLEIVPSSAFAVKPSSVVSILAATLIAAVLFF